MKTQSGAFFFLALLLSFHVVTCINGVTTEEERVAVCLRTCRGPQVTFEACCNEVAQILNLNHDYRKRGGDLYDNDYRFGKRNTVVLDENEENTVESWPILYRTLRLGKRNPMTDDVLRMGKRAPFNDVMRMGKRAPFDDTLRMGKRVPYDNVMRMGKRAPFDDTLRMGKRAPFDDTLRMGKRAPFDDTLRMGKRAPFDDTLRMGKREYFEDEDKDDGYILYRRTPYDDYRLGKRTVGNDMMRMGKRLDDIMRIGKRSDW